MPRHLIPNSTQIPDLILDDWMHKLTPPEFMVIMAIARKTYGWGKQSDTISNTQLQKLTGLGKTAVSDILSRLTHEGGPIIKTPSTLPLGHPQAWNSYGLNTDWDGDLPNYRSHKNGTNPPAQATPPPRRPPRPDDANPPAQAVPNPPAQAVPTRDSITRDKTRAHREESDTPCSGDLRAPLEPTEAELLALDQAFDEGKFGGTDEYRYAFNPRAYEKYQSAYKALHLSGYTPEQVKRGVFEMCRGGGKFSKPTMVTPDALATHIKSFLPSAQPEQAGKPRIRQFSKEDEI